MGGLKLTFKLGPKKPASDGGGVGSGGSAPSAPPRTLPSGPGNGVPHPFAAGARTGGGEAGASPSGARPKVPAALLKAKLERERAAAGAASRGAGSFPSEAATVKGVPKALLMKGVPKALQGGGKPAPGVSSGKVEKKKVKRPIPAGAVPGLPGVKIRLVAKPGGGVGAASAAAAATAAMDPGYDSWGEGDDATPKASNLGTLKRARDAAASDDRSRGAVASESGLVPGPVPAFVEPPPKPNAMNDLIKKLQAKDKHGVFAEPVTEAIAPGYFSTVTTPMDFRTLRENVRLGKYQSWDAFVQDVELIFANAMAYNPVGTAVHALAAKTLEHARRAAEKARNAGLSPGARAKRAKIAHVASMASFGGDDRSPATGAPDTRVSVDDPSQSRGPGAPSSTGFEEDEDDDDEVGGGNDEDDKKKKKETRFKRHTFAELRSRAAMPSLEAWRRAGGVIATGAVVPAKPIAETPQVMVRPSATFFQKRAAAESYAGSLASWGSALRGRARVAATRLARAAAALTPPPPPRPPSPPPREPSPACAEEDDPAAAAYGAAENDDGSESDDDSPLISIVAKARGEKAHSRGAPTLPAANAQKSLALAAAAAAASQRASASVKTAGLISRGQVAAESQGDPLPPLRAQLGLPPGGGFVDVVRGVHADLSRGLGAVRDRLRGAGFGKEHAIVPAPPPLPATRRRS